MLLLIKLDQDSEIILYFQQLKSATKRLFGPKQTQKKIKISAPNQDLLLNQNKLFGVIPAQEDHDTADHISTSRLSHQHKCPEKKKLLEMISVRKHMILTLISHKTMCSKSLKQQIDSLSQQNSFHYRVKPCYTKNNQFLPALRRDILNQGKVPPNKAYKLTTQLQVIEYLSSSTNDRVA